MTAERDRFLTEALGHKFKKPGHGTCCTCSACGYDYDNCICIDYSEWQGFGILWEWATKQDWFMNLYEDHMYGAVNRKYKPTVHNLKFFINPDGFANRIYEFLKNNEEGKDE